MGVQQAEEVGLSRRLVGFQCLATGMLLLVILITSCSYGDANKIRDGLASVGARVRSDGSVEIEWSPIVNADFYEVFRSSSADGVKKLVAKTPVTKALDLRPNRDYVFFNDDHLNVAYEGSGWMTEQGSQFGGGTAHITHQPGDSVTVVFDGTGVVFMTTRISQGPDTLMDALVASVELDGRPVEDHVVLSYSGRPGENNYVQGWSVAGLPKGKHVVTIPLSRCELGSLIVEGFWVCRDEVAVPFGSTAYYYVRAVDVRGNAGEFSVSAIVVPEIDYRKRIDDIFAKTLEFICSQPQGVVQILPYIGTMIATPAAIFSLNGDPQFRDAARRQLEYSATVHINNDYIIPESLEGITAAPNYQGRMIINLMTTYELLGDSVYLAEAEQYLSAMLESFELRDVSWEGREYCVWGDFYHFHPDTGMYTYAAGGYAPNQHGYVALGLALLWSCADSVYYQDLMLDALIAEYVRFSYSSQDPATGAVPYSDRDLRPDYETALHFAWTWIAHLWRDDAGNPKDGDLLLHLELLRNWISSHMQEPHVGIRYRWGGWALGFSRAFERLFVEYYVNGTASSNWIDIVWSAAFGTARFEYEGTDKESLEGESVYGYVRDFAYKFGLALALDIPFEAWLGDYFNPEQEQRR